MTGYSRKARIFARPKPDKRACRSSGGEYEPAFCFAFYAKQNSIERQDSEPKRAVKLAVIVRAAESRVLGKRKRLRVSKQ